MNDHEKSENLDRMSDDYLKMAAECLKVMAHPVRLRIVEILSQGRFSVGKIAELCALPHNQTCEHLRLMKGHGLLDSEREGRTVYYRIVAPQLTTLLSCIRKNCPACPQTSQ